MTIEHDKIHQTNRKWVPDESLFESHASAVRASVKPTRLYLDNEYFKKGYGAIFPHRVTVVYAVLAMFANHKTQTCYPSAQTIMDMAGITNRNSVFEAIKILEAYDIIAVAHRSKGRVPNIYAMLEHYGWNEINSINFDTVMQRVRKKRTVSKKEAQQSQNESDNGNAGDTGSNLIDSDNYEITPQAAETGKLPLKGRQLLEGLSPMAKSVVAHCFREEDIIAALEELCEGGSEVEKLGYKPVLQTLLRRGSVPTKEIPSWIKL